MSIPNSCSIAPVTDSFVFERAFAICTEKTLRNLPALAASGRTWAFHPVGHYEEWIEGFLEIGNWTAGFFAGMGVLGWRQSGNLAFLHRLLELEPLFQRKVTEGAADTMHDLGFLFSPYAVALATLTGEGKFRDLGIRAAELLAGRFIPAGNYIRAWGRMDEQGTNYDGLAIIDCMMNLPLLYWAGEVTGEARFREIALRHSDTTLAHFIREDGSVYHSFRFHEDGTPKGPDNYCGRAVESHWARGAAWAMYGFALGYRHTRDERYLEASMKVTRKWVSLLDEEVVPVWDFRLGEGETKLRDSSAAAIAVCAIQELGALGNADAEMIVTKKALLARLCSDDYFDSRLGVRGVLKKGEVGDGVGKARYAYTSWGDYFFMEGLAREIGVEVSWW
ncbi:unsaturated chondroitin disaccharide hydrolase [Haloferula luteola]|uniref:Unsaturated chondroitin disaccharide hydrolase n=1 Tax=Haloferula luteola TaxID=595692 RepID=A0A840V605_9BACT|nr:glycoside hydrolase family 88 protein [Haloferula luteola]MBB5353455.1 unsaturated chondroitin disaccharide hydrolase [Haloferula luteola]